MGYIIKRSNLAPSLNLLIIFVTFSCLHYWVAPNWLLYGLPSLQVIAWITNLKKDITSIEIDLFDGLEDEDKKTVTKRAQSKFQERLKDLYEKNKAKQS